MIFSVLLLSSILVFASAQDRARLYLQSNAEDALSDQGAALMGGGAATILLETQAFLGSGVLGCPTAVKTAAAAIGAFSALQRSGGLTVRVSASAAGGGPPDDNLSMVAPFNGSMPGDVDILLAMVASGGDSSAGVSYAKTETHVVHLPVMLEELESDCLSAVGAVSTAVQASAPANCTRAAVAPVISAASRTAAARAEADGFSFSLGFTTFSWGRCAVQYDVGLVQAGVQGPGGEFSARLEDEGIASFGQAPSPPQG